MDDRYTSALEALRAAGQQPGTFARPFVDVLPVAGASVSTVGPMLGSQTLSATDELAARLDELQFDLSEGPCWDSLAARRPVLEPSLAAPSAQRWPNFGPAASAQGVNAIFAFPLVVGTLPIGAVDLYSLEHMTLTLAERKQASAMSDIISRHILRRAIDGSVDVDEDGANAFSRRVIHQATGVVIAQLQLSPDDARLVIQGHAFAEGRPMKEIAEQILDGGLSFTNSDSGIEASE
jgi:hypothetical protein